MKILGYLFGDGIPRTIETKDERLERLARKQAELFADCKPITRALTRRPMTSKQIYSMATRLYGWERGKCVASHCIRVFHALGFVKSVAVVGLPDDIDQINGAITDALDRMRGGKR